MIDDLKRDSAAWEKEQRERRQQPKAQPARSAVSSKSRGGSSTSSNPDVAIEAYVDSRTHKRRQMYGPSEPETPTPVADFPPGRGPPPPLVDYRQQAPSPGSDTQYPVQSPGGPYAQATRSQAYQGGYAPIPDQGPSHGNMAPYDYQGYPQDSIYGAQPVQGQPPIGAVGGYPPQPPQTAPPMSSR